jgi:molecular chaperone GrpE
MTDERKIRVTDKRRTGTPSGESEPTEIVDAPEARVVEEPVMPEAELLNKLAYLQADFDNYRKRMMREQTEIAKRAEARMLEKLLPVLDNFERALDHEPEGSSLGILQRELIDSLKSEGLQEIEALGTEFDPRFHEAVESHEDPEVSLPTVTSVHRRGYMLAEKVLRPAMVGVARPAETLESFVTETTDEEDSA